MILSRILLIAVAIFGSGSLLAEEIPASLHWAQITTLSTPLSGRISSTPVKVGDNVKKNKLLAALDPRPFQAKIRRNKAEVKRLEVRYQDIKREYDRARELYDRTVLSTTDLQSAETRFDAASASLDRARADLKLAQLDLEYSQLRAPFDGIVTERLINTGETVINQCSATPMIRIARTDKLLATARITPQQAKGLVPSGNISVVAAGQRFVGTVIAIRATPGNHSLLELNVEFNTDGNLRQGGKAIIEIDTPVK
ncbi:MAG TPA: efflux RND transporter periplasmic adaptor subunit [Gammaproteobacteria bacterium]|nr:efflux RND transporter periplasmic adaptor subunit [Gammaproteobacteria bacterium]